MPQFKNEAGDIVDAVEYHVDNDAALTELRSLAGSRGVSCTEAAVTISWPKGKKTISISADKGAFVVFPADGDPFVRGSEDFLGEFRPTEG